MDSRRHPSKSLLTALRAGLILLGASIPSSILSAQDLPTPQEAEELLRLAAD